MAKNRRETVAWTLVAALAAGLIATQVLVVGTVMSVQIEMERRLAAVEQQLSCSGE